MKRLACPHCGVEVPLIATLARGEPKWRMTPIDELPISVRAFNAVRADGNYKTAGDLADVSDRSLAMTDGIGRKGLLEIRAAVAQLKEDRA